MFPSTKYFKDLVLNKFVHDHQSILSESSVLLQIRQSRPKMTTDPDEITTTLQTLSINPSSTSKSKPTSTSTSPHPQNPSPPNPHPPSPTPGKTKQAPPQRPKPQPQTLPQTSPKTDAVARRLIAGALGIRAPKKSDEQREYERVQREKESRRRQEEREESERRRQEEERVKRGVWED
ncbi:hypothetical protein EYC80_010528 [Monilinia laxa]|uniref:Uncharacterized protein n=2 Tax=Monilinia laxa TaxID=61186 RepID=A0A5N6JQI0_MONLA|nr:hypothetical protein EYC80_010528 [Monilinia laxa]